MKVSFINQYYRRFYKQHKPEIDKAIQSCLEIGSLMFGKETEKFEKNFAKFCKKKYCVSLNSGTTSINLAIASLKSPHWIRQNYFYKIVPLLNSEQVKVDDEGVMDLKLLEEKIKKKKSSVLITYMNSVQPDLNELKRLKNKYKFYLVEDACQAIGKPLIGDLSCFSFYPAKMLGGIGKGGAVVSNNLKLITFIKKIRDDKFNNLWLDEIKTAFLNIKLKYLPENIKRRQEIADLYTKHLSGIKEIKILSKQCLQNYIVITKKHKRLMAFLQRKNIEIFPDKSSFYAENLKNAIRLPIYSELTNEEIFFVIRSIKEFYL